MADDTRMLSSSFQLVASKSGQACKENILGKKTAGISEEAKNFLLKKKRTLRINPKEGRKKERKKHISSYMYIFITSNEEVDAFRLCSIHITKEL